MKKFNIFISYRNSCSADRAQLLLALLESKGYKGQVSFDKDNLTGLFDTTIIRRIDNCKDFIIIISQDTFKYLDNYHIIQQALSAIKDYEAFNEELAKYKKIRSTDYTEVESPLKYLFNIFCNTGDTIEGVKKVYFGYKNGALYKYLSECSEQEFEDVIRRIGTGETVKIQNGENSINIKLEADEHLDFVRIELGRILNRRENNNEKVSIIPLVSEDNGTFKFSGLDIPPDIIDVKRYQAVVYSESSQFLFKDAVSRLIPRLISKPNILRKYLIIILCFLIGLILCAIPSIMHYMDDVAMLNKCITYNDYVSLGQDSLYYSFMQQRCNDSISLFDVNMKEWIRLHDANGEKKDSIKMDWNPNISMVQLKCVTGLLDSMMYVRVKDFKMGRNDYMDIDGPAHNVRLSSDFYMYKYEISRNIWFAVMSDSIVQKDGQLPMTNISWKECQKFISTLSLLSGLKFSLPTEAQWEYASNGGNVENKYAGSNDISQVAYYRNNSKGRIHNIGKLSPNVFELYDMSGNVSEWCADWASGPYDLSEVFDPIGPKSGTKKIIRGGDYATEEEDMQVTYRDTYPVDEQSPKIGFRIVMKK